MTGGAGNDRFDIDAVAETGVTDATRDIVADFQHLVDKIDLSTIDASTVQAQNNAFTWKNSGAITTSTAGELRYQQFNNAGTANDYTLVSGDTDADTAAEFQLRLTGLITLTSADFVL